MIDSAKRLLVEGVQELGELAFVDVYAKGAFRGRPSEAKVQFHLPSGHRYPE